MDPSKSNDSGRAGVALPKRRFNTEFFVGVFTLFGVFAAGWLAVGLGDVNLFGSSTYDIFAEFDNVSGLKSGASVEIAGVPVGSVNGISLKDSSARITLRLNEGITIRDEDIASIRTKGIIGDRYVKISRGSSDAAIPPGGVMIETESVVDIEDIIGKIVHNLGGKDDDEKESAGSPAPGATD